MTIFIMQFFAARWRVYTGRQNTFSLFYWTSGASK